MHYFHSANKYRPRVICTHLCTYLTDIPCEQLGLDTYYLCHIYKFSSLSFSALISINMTTVRRSIIIFDETVQANLKSSGISRILHVTKAILTTFCTDL